MADSIVDEPLPLTSSNPSHNSNNFATEFNSLEMPSLDSLFMPQDNDNNPNFNMYEDSFLSDLGLGLGFGDNEDFELTLDGLDDLYLPSENEEFLIPEAMDNSTGSMEPSCSALTQLRPHAEKIVNLQSSVDYAARVSCLPSPESDNSGVSGEQGGSDADNFLKFPSPESRNSIQECSPPNSGDCNSDASRALNSPSAEHGPCDRECSGESVSSQGSGSVVCETMNYPSPDSDAYDCTVDQKVKLEETGKISAPKRKKDQEEGNKESRTTKYRKSSILTDSADRSGSDGVNDDEEKRKARLMRNRESAQLSRQRKKHYVEELVDKVKSMHAIITDLNSKISYIMAENATLRQQLSGGAMCQPSPPGMYPHPPMAPMGYPWMPCAPYVVKPPGSQVPLVPIPRLKPRQPVSAPKAKKNGGKKIEGKTKKVASVSFLGLLFFILLFGGLAPIVDVKFGGIGERVAGGSSYLSNRFYDRHGGRVLRVNGYSNGSGESVGIGSSCAKFDISSRVGCGRKASPQGSYDSDQHVKLGNASDPLVASLYVPRNDKLVKIDGNLIIHSILASEKAMASHKAPEAKNERETSLVISKDLAPALAIPEVGVKRGGNPNIYRKPSGRLEGLASGPVDNLKDHIKSTRADGELQQWFREGLAGPMLSSGMCTEVFQFDVSPASTPGAIIIPASSSTSVSNASIAHHQNATQRNRRILRGLPVPFRKSSFNYTEQGMDRNHTPHEENFHGNNKSVSSSMVVSVLVDPRETGDNEVDGMVKKPKSLARIFVVVLLDSVKYVTYSCVLPRSGPQLVTT